MTKFKYWVKIIVEESCEKIKVFVSKLYSQNNRWMINKQNYQAKSTRLK